MFKKTGRCIWCGKTEPEVTFNSAPHILPQKLGGKEIGFDICDACNHYFGTATAGKPNIDLVFKEIFNAYRFFDQELDATSYKKYHSVFFSYRHSSHTIKINKSFCSNVITRQFKRALYNVFFQKYHEITKNGNHPMFNNVRNFARYDIGDPHVYYTFNNIRLVPDNKYINNPYLKISKVLIDDMMDSGIFSFWFMGEEFFLEVFPLAFQTNGEKFLQKRAQHILIPAIGNERIFEFTDVMQLDFFLQRFNRK